MDRSGPADAGADQAARLIATRRSWHGVAELVMAGPQYRRSGSIKLRVVPGGFSTVAEPDLRVDAAELVAGDRRHLLTGVTCRPLRRRIAPATPRRGLRGRAPRRPDQNPQSAFGS